MTRKKNAPGRCVFCDGTGLTKEHIFSDWLGRILPPTEDHVNTDTAIHFDHNARTAHVTPLQKKRQGGLNTRKIRNVCEVCNGGWMKGIVDRAKPFAERMIQGLPVCLNKQNQTDVAAWITLASIMAEFTDLRTQAIPPADRKLIMVNGSPPPSWTVAIGRYCDENWDPIAYRHWGSHFGASQANKTEPHGFHVTTYTLSHLLVHSFSCTENNLASAYRKALAPLGHLLIWPILNDEVNWPPDRVFKDNDVEELPNSLAHYSIGMMRPASYPFGGQVVIYPGMNFAGPFGNYYSNWPLVIQPKTSPRA